MFIFLYAHFEFDASNAFKNKLRQWFDYPWCIISSFNSALLAFGDWGDHLLQFWKWIILRIVA